MTLWAVVDPDVVIDLNDRAVVEVMEACFADSKALIAVCEDVDNFVYTLAELAFVANWLFMVL